MQGLADASGSRFHVSSMSGLLDQTEPFLTRMIANQLTVRRPAEPDDDLGRLAQSMMQGNAAAAQAALEDHLILLGRYLDCPAPSGRF
jgi:DNA-binding FadR family transcriptional regulator